jgi:molybdopterin synthase catalytic subunit
MSENGLIVEPDGGFLHEGPVPHGKVGEVASSYSSDPAIGGVASFCGLVRADETPQGRVAAIEFTAQTAIAERHLAALIRRIAAGYESGALRVHLEHALGTVPAGESPLLIVVGAVHREEAFGVCRDVLEALKAEVPIYGKELTEGGGHRWKVNR